jgi:hypothetical protein
MTTPTASGPTWPNSHYGPFGAAKIEARGLAHLVAHGASVEAVRELIAVSPELEAELPRDAELVAGQYPGDAERMLAIIAWRREVLAGFVSTGVKGSHFCQSKGNRVLKASSAGRR